MGWNYDYNFDYLKEQANQKSKNANATRFLATSREILL